MIVLSHRATFISKVFVVKILNAVILYSLYFIKVFVLYLLYPPTNDMTRIRVESLLREYPKFQDLTSMRYFDVCEYVENR